MPSRKPIKNIKPVLSDIRHKGEKYTEPPRKPQPKALSRFRPRGEVKLRGKKGDEERVRKLRALAAAGVSLAAVILIWWTGARIMAQTTLSDRYAASKQNLLQLLESPSSSTVQFVSLNRNGGFTFPFINQFSAAMRSVNGLGASTTDLSSAMINLGNSWLSDFFGGNGRDLLSSLLTIKTDLASIASSNNELLTGSDLSISSSGEQSADLESKILLFQNGADGLYDLLNATSSHILLIFTDPTSSLRPAGGEITSYADLSVSGGEESGVAVESISVPDSKPGVKILPPPELQEESTGWNAGEANWFFDFPTSAGKIISFMQSSGAYSESGTRFSGVILLDSQSLRQIIAAVDSTLLPKNGISVVSAGYLRTALPEILSEVASSTPSVQQDFLGAVDGGLSSKDIMMFFADSKMESFISSLGYDGGAYSLPYNFNGDYLGVTNTTPQPAKTGTYLSEHVIVESQIDQSGTVSDNLTIENSYSNPASWYHDFRRTLVRIFTPPSSALISADGMSKPVFGSLGQYRAGYSTDPDLSAIENSSVPSGVSGVSEETESGLKAYGAWLNGYIGDAESLKINYVSGNAVVSPGEKFYFVFDKQSGVNQTLDYLVQAPLGYGWEEAPGEGSVYSYHSSELSPRTVIPLTLVKE